MRGEHGCRGDSGRSCLLSGGESRDVEAGVLWSWRVPDEKMEIVYAYYCITPVLGSTSRRQEDARAHAHAHAHAHAVKYYNEMCITRAGQ
ncbi:hypothetical protein M0802_006701 [Mischocyttarus mexicanus]|nr:hypothetical protein M0802_006701 [Mischocyttarus mexicanus]